MDEDPELGVAEPRGHLADEALVGGGVAAARPRTWPWGSPSQDVVSGEVGRGKGSVRRRGRRRRDVQGAGGERQQPVPNHRPPLPAAVPARVRRIGSLPPARVTGSIVVMTHRSHSSVVRKSTSPMRTVGHASSANGSSPSTRTLGRKRRTSSGSRAGAEVASPEVLGVEVGRVGGVGALGDPRVEPGPSTPRWRAAAGRCPASETTSPGTAPVGTGDGAARRVLLPDQPQPPAHPPTQPVAHVGVGGRGERHPGDRHRTGGSPSGCPRGCSRRRRGRSAGWCPRQRPRR